MSAGQDKIAELGRRRRETIAQSRAISEQVRADLADLLGEDLALEGDVPLVLLPVRLEVRSTLDGSALRVRIFPDAVHTESLDEGLSGRGASGGIVYWTAVWADGDPQEPWPDCGGDDRPASSVGRAGAAAAQPRGAARSGHRRSPTPPRRRRPLPSPGRSPTASTCASSRRDRSPDRPGEHDPRRPPRGARQSGRPHAPRDRRRRPAARSTPA